jgi:hypothetical protein
MNQIEPIRIEKHGHNQYTNDWANMPYPLKYARAKVMLDRGASYSEVRAATGLAPSTIAKVKKGEKDIDQTIADVLKKEEGAKLTHLIHGTLDAISAEDVKKASLLQKVTSAAIMIEKRNLVEGKATQINGFASVNDDDINREIEELESKLSQWEEGKIVNTSTLSGESESVDSQQDAKLRDDTVEG